MFFAAIFALGLLAVVVTLREPFYTAAIKSFPKFPLGGRPASIPAPDNWERTKLRRSDGATLAAILKEVEGPYVVVASHGGSTRASKASMHDMVPYGELFESLGVSTLAYDAYGFGHSDGFVSPQGFASGMDVASALEWARLRFPDKVVGVLGFSRGAVTSLRVVSESVEQPDFFVIEGVGNERWSDIDIDRDRYGWRENLNRWMAFRIIACFGLVGFRRPRPPLMELVKEVTSPALFVAAEADREERARVEKIFSAFGGPKIYVAIDAKDHGGTLVDGGADYKRALKGLLDQYLRCDSS